MPAIVTAKPLRIRVRCGWRPARRSAANEESAGRRRRGEDQAGLYRVVAADDLQKKPRRRTRSRSARAIGCSVNQAEVGGCGLRNSAVDNSASRPARSGNGSRGRIRTGPECRRAAARPSASRFVGGEDCPSRPGSGRAADSTAPTVSKGGRVRWERVSHVAPAEHDDHDDDEGLKMNAARQLIAEAMSPPISVRLAAPMPPIALIVPNARARETQVGEEQIGEDVDRRMSKRGADPPRGSSCR